jgi:hypothetical protein
LEALTPIDAEIFEVPAGSEDAMGWTSRVLVLGALSLSTWPETRIGVWPTSFYHPSRRL